MPWHIELALKLWEYSPMAGAFCAGLSCAGVMRYLGAREIRKSREAHLRELREMKEQLLIELQIKQLNGHAHDTDERV